MKARSLVFFSFFAACRLASADPQVTSWLTDYSTRYARIYQTDAAKSAGTTVTTWTNGSQNQASPAYCGVQEVSYSASWVYIRSTGLGSHVMGPWYLNAAHTQTFPNLPANQHALYRFPRTPSVPTTKTLTGNGAIGYFVDGVAMFDSRDAFYWNGSSEVSGTGYWNREAFINEGVTFDPGYAHQEQTGTHHYHANPIALRYLLADHVDFNAATKAYAESTSAVTRHSPIVGWVRDGYPVYGPYGYSSAMDAGSGVRRMVSGYALRNGSNGTDNLTSTGRTTIPAWAQRMYGVSASQSGPSVSTTYPLGRYMEDNAYLGDLGKTKGVDFDLDEYNGRYCVTPEFPNGTYAYFVALNANGAPAFPYNIGRAFYGNPTGSAQTSIAETVTTVFSGGPSKQEVAAVSSVNAANGNVTLVWSSAEGGTYKVEATNNLSSWSTLTTTQAAATNATSTGYVESGAALGSSSRFYRVTRTSLATYDAVTSTGGGTGTEGISTVSPSSGTRGSTVTLTITLNSSAQPPPPPATLQPLSSTLTQGATTITASSSTRNTTTGVVTSTFTLPANTATGAYSANVTFAPPPGQQNNITFTKTNAFTILATGPSTLRTTKFTTTR